MKYTNTQNHSVAKQIHCAHLRIYIRFKVHCCAQSVCCEQYHRQPDPKSSLEMFVNKICTSSDLVSAHAAFCANSLSHSLSCSCSCPMSSILIQPRWQTVMWALWPCSWWHSDHDNALRSVVCCQGLPLVASLYVIFCPILCFKGIESLCKHDMAVLSLINLTQGMSRSSPKQHLKCVFIINFAQCRRKRNAVCAGNETTVHCVLLPE